MSDKTIYDEIIRKHQINCFKELRANGFRGVLTMSLEPIENNNSNTQSHNPNE